MNQYVGNELELFASATNWKVYWRRQILPYFKGDILDIGAGAGATRSTFSEEEFSSWHAVEPDERYAAAIRYPKTIVTTGTLKDINGLFDTILYIDVLEHIEDDRRELKQACLHLRAGGHLVVLSPSHNSLFSPFDAAIGHYRRYNREMLAALTPDNTSLIHTEYIDSVGMLLSLANRWLLQSSSPTKNQIQIWDKMVVPISRLLDPLFGRKLGKSIIAVWQRSC
ncbi:MAG: class I SAM-dependent methyltransferase [Pseudomonadales bacterium]|nr:class I SAM-dependent methyltransferase [Pseudomonadales bacterium]MBO6594938.1 class I SAM-dependent methyltransferase [Pseudomonadales bacterium]MBO6701443.1 class I SAM-dependent methyltransferase [Pseudomonadales bacterium]MBO6821503.1 class I SAM-dependent methyltransferase [Pseudomonadales bacterium]MBO7005672.1 class I SAM-dependent methyltransferase [Pseudomonadales bacterium]